MKTLIIGLISILVLHTYADSRKIIRTKNISMRLNATGGQVECLPGTEPEQFGLPTRLIIRISPELFGVTSAAANFNTDFLSWEGDMGNQCAQFDVYLKAPNPSWIDLDGQIETMNVKQTVFGNKCVNFIVEKMNLKIKNTNYILKGESHFAIDKTDGACK